MKIKLLLIRYNAVITDDGTVLKHDLLSLVLSLLAVLVEICTTTYSVLPNKRVVPIKRV